MKRFTRVITYASISLISITSLARPSFALGTLHTVIANGPPERRINIVILAEGYTAAQESQFLVDANKTFSTLLSASPWQEYESYVNAYALFIPSAQSGADDPSNSVFRDTYFNSTFDSYGTARLLTIPPNDKDPNYADGYGKVYDLLASFCPSYDIAVLLVNDQQYGGSGGTFAISSVNSSAAEIMIHELGHSYAKLGDEYASSFPGFPDVEEPNTTRQILRALVKWNSWIALTMPIPTLSLPIPTDGVGLFEGAHYHSTGWYRPACDCKMKTLGTDFCPVCSESHVLANYSLVSPIDSVYPESPSVTTDSGSPTTLNVVPMRPSSHELLSDWYADGQSLPNAGTAFDTRALTPGVHSIKCVVSDTTSLVRSDPEHRLSDSAEWTVTVSVPCVCTCHGDPSCDGAVGNVIDVVMLIDMVNRGAPKASTGDCSFADADLDCNGLIDFVDIVIAVDVTFRNADPDEAICNPCVH